MSEQMEDLLLTRPKIKRITIFTYPLIKLITIFIHPYRLQEKKS